MSALNPRPLELRTHRVAREAYVRVEARKGDGEHKQYGALVHKLPGMILQNGLAQTTGFLLAKGDSHHRAVLMDLAALLRSVGATDTDDPPTLHKRVIEADLRETLLLTRRALEVAGWMKRYVQGVLRVDATGTTDGAES